MSNILPKLFTFLILSALPLAVIVTISGCSELQTEIPTTVKSGVHPSGFTVSSSAAFHGRQIAASGNWLLTDCQRCHAKDYSGGATLASCKTSGCHTSAKGPEACNTCHGVFADSSEIAPPRGLHGEIFYTQPAVGAHQRHLTGGTVGRKVNCEFCHTVPALFSAASHIDADGRAELVFDSTAVTATDTLHPRPAYNRVNFSCANTYCHGNFKNGNITNAPVWNSGAAGAACGSCHGTGKNPLPKGTHPPVQNCQFCHSSVIRVTITATDTTYTFTDVNKHVNGKTDF